MTLKEFDTLTKKDFENGAVIDEIRQIIKDRDSYKGALREIAKSADEISDFSACDVADVDSPAMNLARSIAKQALKEEESRGESGPPCSVCGKTLGTIMGAVPNAYATMLGKPRYTCNDCVHGGKK